MPAVVTCQADAREKGRRDRLMGPAGLAVRMPSPLNRLRMLCLALPGAWENRRELADWRMQMHRL
jgi:hypothetical protein